jgi:hypothetical protein
MSDTHTVLYDPHGLIEAELPLDRAPYEALVTAVLAWKNPDLEPRDYEQISLQLTGHARAVGGVVIGPDSDSDEQALDLVAGQRDQVVRCGLVCVFVGAYDGEEGMGQHRKGDPAGQEG